jgi:hypothetical protein
MYYSCLLHTDTDNLLQTYHAESTAVEPFVDFVC